MNAQLKVFVLVRMQFARMFAVAIAVHTKIVHLIT